MNIIGHRGAAGLALENTISSIKTAIAIGVDAVEFDVRLTKDKKFVLSHDSNMHRVSGKRFKIADITHKQSQKISLHNGEKLCLLSEARAAANGTKLFIEAKGSGWATALAVEINNSDYKNATVIAMDHKELGIFHRLMPDVPTYAVQKFHESDFLTTLQAARSNKFTGIDLNVWMLNPLTYWLAHRHKLKVVVYTVNHAWLARFIARIFPNISITTNHPERMQFLRTHIRGIRKNVHRA